MREVFIVGVGMTRFAKYMDRSLKYLTGAAVDHALSDARLVKEDMEAVWFSNSAWGYYDDQQCIRGQVALRSHGLEGLPIYNVENACAGGSTALHSAWMGVAAA